MAKYKRKKVKKRLFSSHTKGHSNTVEPEFLSTPKEKPRKEKKKKVAESEPIDNDLFFEEETTNSEQKYKRKSFKVLKGNLVDKRKKILTVTLVALILAVVIVALSVLLPIGITDSITAAVKTIGSGEYPIQFANCMVEDCVVEGGYYFVLSDTSVMAYSKAGKEIFSVAHGMTSPILKTSDTRALVFEQNGNKLSLYNLNGLIKSFTYKENIITAAVGRNGAYAVVKSGTEYASTVTVYSRNNRRLFEWNSAKDIVNNVCLSPYAQKIAVSTLNATGGKYVSALNVLDFDSADPVFSKSFDENVIYALRPLYFGFAAVTEEKYCCFDWSKYQSADYFSADRRVDCFKTLKDRTVVVFNRKNDGTDNEIKTFSAFGKVKHKFEFKGNIVDITANGDDVFVLSDTKVCRLDENGKVVSSAVCNFGCEKIIAISNDTVAVISDSGIEQIKLEKGEK